MVLLQFLEKILRNDHFLQKENESYFQFLFLEIWKCLGEVTVCHLDNGNDNNLFLLWIVAPSLYYII